MKVQSGGRSSANAVSSPARSHVSVKNIKSKFLDVKKSFKMNVLLVIDLALISANRRVGSAVEDVVCLRVILMRRSRLGSTPHLPPLLVCRLDVRGGMQAL